MFFDRFSDNKFSTTEMTIPLTVRPLSFSSNGNPRVDRMEVHGLWEKQVSTMDKTSPLPEPPDPPWCGPDSSLLIRLHRRCFSFAHLAKSQVLCFISCSFDCENHSSPSFQLVSAGAPLITPTDSTPALSATRSLVAQNRRHPLAISSPSAVKSISLEGRLG
ncbi:unnamed protein product [Arabis nemorensis]|uniref:Uncharacterized protein n=1 Tax=Arabis nemorensis TaxID=586526 RepID=A0A565CU46_9BRAS|nr:unnamed protein product [Arabis nemorensis]